MEKSVQQTELTKSEYDIGSIQRYLICGHFLLAYWEPYLDGTLGSFSKYYILFLMFVLCLKHPNLKIRSFHWCFLCWLTLKLISVLWTTNMYVPELHLFSQLGMIALLIVLTAIPIDQKTISSIVTTMWIGSAVIGILSLFFSHPYLGIVAKRQVLYLFGQEADPNDQAAFVLSGLAISLYSLIVLRKYRVISVFVILVNSYSLFSTGSRGGLVGLLGIAMFILFVSFKEKNVHLNIKAIGIIGFVCLALSFVAVRFLSEDIFARLFVFEDYEGGSNREMIWANGWDLFTAKINFLLFGAGWGAYYGYNNVFKFMHNTFLSILCDVGIFGFLVFFVPIGKCIFKLVKKDNVLPVLLLICAFISSFFLEGINKRFFWNGIVFLFIVYVNSQYSNKESGVNDSSLFLNDREG